MSDFILKKIELSGFRGFTVKQEFTLGHPITIVYGGNRTGKSSLLNAVEWCLFGPQVAVAKYGDIRERKNWESTPFYPWALPLNPDFRFKTRQPELTVMNYRPNDSGPTD